MWMGSLKAKEIINGLKIIKDMKGNTKRVKGMVMVLWIGVMGIRIKVSGRTEKCMERVFLNIKMVIDMKANFSRVKLRVKGLSTGNYIYWIDIL